MKQRKIRWIVFGLALVLMAALALGLVSRPSTRAEQDGTLRLKAPSFVQVAAAKEGIADPAVTVFPDDEIGISAYIKTATSITLDDVRGEFRTIELETAQYIIGSVPSPGYAEIEEAHVYVHVDGWVIAYYREDEPVSKIIDLVTYDGGAIDTTKLRNVIQVITSAAGAPLPGVSYYDFRYPNATHMTIIGEKDTVEGDTFQIELTSTYGYSERSWALMNKPGSGVNPSFYLDGIRIGNCGYCYGTLSAAQLLPDTVHTVQVNYNNTGDNGALVLIYTVPE